MDLRKFIPTKKGTIEHLVNTSSQVVSMSPIYAAVEVTALGMSDAQSIDAKIAGAVGGYLGTGWLYVKGRDILDKKLKVPEKGIVRSVFDTGYTMAFSAALAPSIYFICGERDVNTLLTGGAIAAGIGFFGSIPGYAIDTGRDLMGLGESKRWMPEIVRSGSSKIKKGAAVLATAASIAIMAGTYALTPPGHGEDTEAIVPTPIIEEYNLNK